jgi:hypothetical protein
MPSNILLQYGVVIQHAVSDLFYWAETVCCCYGTRSAHLKEFTCRFFLEPKCHVAGVGRVAPEVTYMRSCVLPDRALKLHRARFPRVDLPDLQVQRCSDADPNHATRCLPVLKGNPIIYTPLVATRCRNNTTSRELVPVDDVVHWCVQEAIRKLVKSSDMGDVDKFQAWSSVERSFAEDKDAVLASARVAVFHRCQLENMLVSSELSSKTLEREGKSEASSYCLVRLDEQADTMVPCFVRYFVLMQWHAAAVISRMAVVCPVEYKTDEDECAAFGQTVFRFDRKDLQTENDILVPVVSIIRPMILIKTPKGGVRFMWRLVQFEGKLLGSFDHSEYS